MRQPERGRRTRGAACGEPCLPTVSWLVCRGCLCPEATWRSGWLVQLLLAFAIVLSALKHYGHPLGQFSGQPMATAHFSTLAAMTTPRDNFSDLLRRKVSGVAFALDPIAQALRSYGEPKVADWLLAIDADTHARISVRAHEIPGMLDKAICLAAVEVFEGSPRELHRKRRVFPKHGQESGASQPPP